MRDISVHLLSEESSRSCIRNRNPTRPLFLATCWPVRILWNEQDSQLDTACLYDRERTRAEKRASGAADSQSVGEIALLESYKAEQTEEVAILDRQCHSFMLTYWHMIFGAV